MRGALNTLSGNFQNSRINTYTWNYVCMIHHHKEKNLNFMMGYVRLRKIIPVLNCDRLNTAMLNQHRWYMSESGTACAKGPTI